VSALGNDYHGSLRNHARRALVSNSGKYQEPVYSGDLSNSVKISKHIQFQDVNTDNSMTMPAYKSRRQLEIEK
jgi:hypothetical protein